MNTLQSFVHARVSGDDASGYTAACDEIAIVVHGETLGDTVTRLRAAVASHLRDEGVVGTALAPRARLRLVIDFGVDDGAGERSGA